MKTEFTGLTTTVGVEEIKRLVQEHLKREFGRLFDRGIRLQFEIDFETDDDGRVNGAVVRIMEELEGS